MGYAPCTSTGGTAPRPLTSTPKILYLLLSESLSIMGYRPGRLGCWRLTVLYNTTSLTDDIMYEPQLYIGVP